MDKFEKVKEIFEELSEKDTDWSTCADHFIWWNIERDFETESFKTFVEHLEDKYLEHNVVWDFFFGYSDDFEKFAEDWVDPDEQVDYLLYCKWETLEQGLQDILNEIKEKGGLHDVSEFRELFEEWTTHDELASYLEEKLIEMAYMDGGLEVEGGYIYRANTDLDIEEVKRYRKLFPRDEFEV